MKRFIIILTLLVSPAMALRADCNGDGRVDVLDLAILSEEWLMSYPDKIAVSGVIEPSYFNGNYVRVGTSDPAQYQKPTSTAVSIAADEVSGKYQIIDVMGMAGALFENTVVDSATGTYDLMHEGNGSGTAIVIETEFGEITPSITYFKEIGPGVVQILASGALVDTLKAYYRLDGDAEWTYGGTKTDEYTPISVSGLTPFSTYQFYISAVRNNIEVAASAIVNVILVYGPELVASPDFQASTGWTVGNGWTISDGASWENVTGLEDNTLRQTISIEPLKTYKIEYYYDKSEAASLAITVGGVDIVLNSNNVTEFTALGTDDLVLTASGVTGEWIDLYAVSVYEVEKLKYKTNMLSIGKMISPRPILDGGPMLDGYTMLGD